MSFRCFSGSSGEAAGYDSNGRGTIVITPCMRQNSTVVYGQVISFRRGVQETVFVVLIQSLATKRLA
jgi:hypothetical protein